MHKDNSHLDKYKFKPGQSGNPKGRPKGAKYAIKSTVKEQTWETLSNLVDLVFNKPESELLEYLNRLDLSRGERVILEESEKMATLEALLDRALGRPGQMPIRIEQEETENGPKLVIRADG